MAGEDPICRPSERVQRAVRRHSKLHAAGVFEPGLLPDDVSQERVHVAMRSFKRTIRVERTRSPRSVHAVDSPPRRIGRVLGRGPYGGDAVDRRATPELTAFQSLPVHERRCTRAASSAAASPAIDACTAGRSLGAGPGSGVTLVFTSSTSVSTEVRAMPSACAA